MYDHETKIQHNGKNYVITFILDNNKCNIHLRDENYEIVKIPKTINYNQKIVAIELQGAFSNIKDFQLSENINIIDEMVVLLKRTLIQNF